MAEATSRMVLLIRLDWRGLEGAGERLAKKECRWVLDPCVWGGQSFFTLLATLPDAEKPSDLQWELGPFARNRTVNASPLRCDPKVYGSMDVVWSMDVVFSVKNKTFSVPPSLVFRPISGVRYGVPNSGVLQTNFFKVLEGGCR